MLNNIRKFFNILLKIDEILLAMYFGKLNGFTIITFVLVGLFFLGIKQNEYFEILIIYRITGAIFLIFIYMFIPYLIFREGESKRFIIFGRKEKYKNYIKEFSVSSYIVFLWNFSICLIIPIYGILMLISPYAFKFINANLDFVVYICAAILSVLWFSYHIINETVSLQSIRVAVNRYIATGSTIILGLNLLRLEKMSLISSIILVSYFWIQYIIELRENEIKT